MKMINFFVNEKKIAAGLFLLAWLLFLTTNDVFLKPGALYRNKQLPDVNLRVKQQDESWMFIIDVNGKPYIVQDFLPVLQGNIPFPDSLSAAKVGTLMLERLRAGKIPSISENDLKQIGLIH